jgi:hypothetical protein
MADMKTSRSPGMSNKLRILNESALFKGPKKSEKNIFNVYFLKKINLKNY